MIGNAELGYLLLNFIITSVVSFFMWDVPVKVRIAIPFVVTLVLFGLIIAMKLMGAE